MPLFFNGRKSYEDHNTLSYVPLHFNKQTPEGFAALVAQGFISNPQERAYCQSGLRRDDKLPGGLVCGF